MSPDQKGIETDCPRRVEVDWFTMSPDQKGIETGRSREPRRRTRFTLSPDQKGIETSSRPCDDRIRMVHTEPRSKGD